MLTEPLLADLLAAGESETVEFKSLQTPLPVLLQMLCALANSVADEGDPAYLLVGVDESGTPQEAELDRDLEGEIQGALGTRLRPAPRLEIQRFLLQGRLVWAISVFPASDGPIKFDGLSYVRVGARTRLAGEDDLRVWSARRRRRSPPLWNVAAVSLENFRLFDRATVDKIPPALLVLVAPNGSGKTSVLDAIALVLRRLVESLTGSQASLLLEASDVRRTLSVDQTMEPILPTRVSVTLQVGSAAYQADYTVDQLWRNGARATTLGKAVDLTLTVVAQQLRNAVTSAAPAADAADTILPTFAYYGTGRLFNAAPVAADPVADTSRLSGYQGCLNPSARFDALAAWFERYSREAQRASDSPHRPHERLRAVQRAVDAVLRHSHWHSLHFDFAQETLSMKHPQHGSLPLAWLSDGLRCVTSLVADLAHRCVRLNPALGAAAARHTPGVVLIDEVDLHLHPTWQQTILLSLQRAFPNLQFIVTTHSGYVLSTVQASSIRMLSSQDEDGRVAQPALQTVGDDSATVAANVLGVNSIPDVAEAHDLTDYRALIQADEAETAEALLLRDKIEKIYGPRHPLVVDCDRLIRFAALRKRAGAGGA